jgi:hypothetical protein
VWRVFWPVARQVLGWFFIALGLLGMVLPVLQGVLFLVIGIALVGRRNIVIRHSRVALKRLLRRWAALPTPVIGRSGRVALRAQREFSRQARQLHRRYDAWVARRFGRSPAAPESRYKRTPDRA